MKKIFISSDHAGYDLKESVKSYLNKKKLVFKDLGPKNKESVDYPDFAHPVASDVEEGTADLGIVVCGSGNGANMTVNKYSGVRSALCWNKELTALARQHNDANILSLPARFIALPQALEMVEVFLNTGFDGGRHERRVEKIPRR